MSEADEPEVFEISEADDRAFVREIGQAIDLTLGLDHRVCCETASCYWAVSTRSESKSQAAYEEHLRVDARHTGGVWIDRDGRARKGLEDPNP